MKLTKKTANSPADDAGFENLESYYIFGLENQE